VKIPIELSTAGEQTNYQKMITIHNSSGTNTIGHIYCNQHCRADFGDIRFTDEYNTELDYWMEDKTDSDNAIIWVEIPVIPSSGVANYYMYYGNPTVSTSSNGTNTFQLFDDFDDSSIDTNLWTVEKKGSSSATVEETGGELHLAGAPNVISSGNLKSNDHFKYNFSIEYMRKTDHENYRDISIGNGSIVDVDTGGSSSWWHTTFYNGYIAIIQSDTIENLVRMDDGTITSLQSNQDPLNHGSYHRNKLLYLENGKIEHWMNDTKISGSSDTTHSSLNKHVLLS